ncbi:MAG: hypothetical protein ACYS8W_16220 [Planctomycetota bacterium]|jgi:hypothetical protein
MDEKKPMGEFTRKFEREVMGRDVPDAPGDTEVKSREALNQIIRLYGLIEERKDWLRQRFPNIVEKETKDEEAAGLRCDFPKDGDHPKSGRMEFRVRDNETHQAIFLECTIEIEGEKPVNDYVSFPVDRVNEAKARKFIQDKIFIFAKSYVANPG